MADCRQFAMATEIVFGRGSTHDVGGGHHSCNGVRGGRQIGGNDFAPTMLGVERASHLSTCENLRRGDYVIHATCSSRFGRRLHG